MSRCLAFVILALLSALSFAACGDDDAPGAPTDPPAQIMETFTGTVTANGAQTHAFTANFSGTITAILTTLTPSDATVGLSLGTLSNNACQVLLANDNATQGTTITGQAGSSGDFCVRVYDATGQLTAPVDYAIDVTHF